MLETTTVNTGATTVGIVEVNLIAFAAMQTEIFSRAIVAAGMAATPTRLERGKLRCGTLIMLRLRNKVVTVYIMIRSALRLLVYDKRVHVKDKINYVKLS